jgi:hypothetical protein
MSRKKEVLEMLAQAGGMLADQMTPEEVLESNLMSAWLQQVSAALTAVGMTDELQLWNETSKVKVRVTNAAELSIYMMSMRAVLLGILHKAEMSP